MHKAKSAEKLLNAFEPARAPWQSALRLFQRSLLEAGSSFELEHSQRLGLLFSKNVGCSDEVQRWASLFNAEDVPTCSMMLKALVHHGNWKAALQLFEWSSDSTMFGQLGEHLAQFMLSKGLEKESLSVATKLLALSKPDAHKKEGLRHPLLEEGLRDYDSLVSNSRAPDRGLVKSVMHDIVGLAQNPVYVPKEEETCYCGLGSVVLRAYPKNSQWKEAASMLHELGACVSGQTSVRLAEYEYARRVYGGCQYQLAKSELASHAATANSLTLQRILLHVALELEDYELALDCLERLTYNGAQCVSDVKLNRFIVGFLQEHRTPNLSAENERRFIFIVVKSSAAIKSSTRAVLRTFFATRNIDADFLATSAEMVPSSFITGQQAALPSVVPSNERVSNNNNNNNTISAVDRTVSVLLRQGKWREALLELDRIKDMQAQTESEEVIRNTVLENSGDWERTLLFFS